MFIGTRTRIIAALAAMAGLFDLNRDRRDHRTVAHIPMPEPRILPPRTEAPPMPSRARVDVRASNWGVWKKPRQEGEMARRVRHIRAGRLQGSNGLLFVTGDRRTACNSHGEPVQFY